MVRMNKLLSDGTSSMTTSRRFNSAGRARSFSDSKEDFLPADLVQQSEEHQQKDGFWMQFALGVVVLCEAAFIGAEIEIGGPKGALHDHDVWYWLAHVFIVFWVILIAVRFYQYGWEALLRAWNVLDLVLTSLAIVDAYIVRFAVADDAMVGSLSVKRQFRIWKLLRLLRLLQIARLFEKLRRLSDGLFASLRIIGLVLILLMIVLYMAGVYMTIIVGHECDNEYTGWDNCDAFFGHVQGSMLSLFQVMTLDDWGNEIVRPSLDEKSWLIAFYVPFMMVTTFGLLNVIVGAVVENTLNAADEQRLKAKKNEEKQIREDLGHLKAFFLEADKDGNGLVDMEEFQAVLKNSTFKAVMKKLSLPTDNPQWLFDVFDVQEKGSVSIEDLTRGLFKFREHPAPMDMHTALMQINGLSAKMSTVEVLLASLLEHHGIQTPPSLTPRVKTGNAPDGQHKAGSSSFGTGGTQHLLFSRDSRLEDAAADIHSQGQWQSPNLKTPILTPSKMARQVMQDLNFQAQMSSLEQSIVRCFEEIRTVQASYRRHREDFSELADRSVLPDEVPSECQVSTETGGRTATGQGTPTPSLRNLRTRSLSRGLSKEVVVL